MLHLPSWCPTDLECGRYARLLLQSAGGGSDAPGRFRMHDGEGTAKRGETVLVVDDDPAVLQVASKVLTRGGYRVIEAESGAQALRLVEESEGTVDLLLTDVVMPGMGGREVSEAIAQRHPGVRVLFMSAYTEDEVILQGVRVAEVNFISKPFTVDGLRAKVREVLDHELN
ncbi:MAG TPA: response regulator [Longimicrobiales bacterium]|nr:response regulator [Longimicrobiales bacterium]